MKVTWGLHDDCKRLDKFLSIVNEMLAFHFHNYKECLCLGDVVMVRGSIVSPHGSRSVCT